MSKYLAFKLPRYDGNDGDHREPDVYYAGPGWIVDAETPVEAAEKAATQSTIGRFAIAFLEVHNIGTTAIDEPAPAPSPKHVPAPSPAPVSGAMPGA